MTISLELRREGTQLLLYLKHFLERCRQISCPELSLNLLLQLRRLLDSLLLQRRVEVLIQYLGLFSVG